MMRMTSAARVAVSTLKKIRRVGLLVEGGILGFAALGFEGREEEALGGAPQRQREERAGAHDGEGAEERDDDALVEIVRPRAADARPKANEHRLEREEEERLPERMHAALAFGDEGGDDDVALGERERRRRGERRERVCGRGVGEERAVAGRASS